MKIQNTDSPSVLYVWFAIDFAYYLCRYLWLTDATV